MKKLFTICLLLVTAFLSEAQESFKMKTYEQNGKIGLLDDKGRKITAAKYDQEIYNQDSIYLGTFTPIFNEGLCSVYINQKVGFIDKNGKEVIPIEFSNVHEFTVEGLAAVEKDGKWGFVNKKGKQTIPIIYNKVFDFEKGKALVILDKEISFIDVNGKALDYGYKLVDEYDETKVLLIKNPFSRLGFLKGNSILPNFYDEIYKSENGMIAVKSGKKYGFIDMHGREIIPVIYDLVYHFIGELAIVKIDPNYGIINKTGKTIVPPKYYSIDEFSEGFAVVKTGDFIKGKKGYIDEKGNEIIPLVYDDAEDFNNGRAKVKIKEDTFFINKKGERIQ